MVRQPLIVRLLVALLLLSQLASPVALAAPSHGVAATTAHCASHAGPSSDADSGAPARHCCDQPSSCHCPQVPATQTLAPALDLGAQAVTLPAPVPPPPLLRRGEQPFRPPI